VEYKWIFLKEATTLTHSLACVTPSTSHVPRARIFCKAWRCDAGAGPSHTSMRKELKKSALKKKAKKKKKTYSDRKCSMCWVGMKLKPRMLKARKIFPRISKREKPFFFFFLESSGDIV
jgi:hypothetical protein